MGYKFTPEAFNKLLDSLKEKYRVYAPILLKGKGKFFEIGRASCRERV